MDNLIFIERIVENKDWATLIFFVGFTIIAINRNVFGVRFTEFTRLIVSDKYLKIYKDNTNLRNSFTISFLVIQLMSITFFIQICLKGFGYLEIFSLISFLRIANLIAFFIISKYIIDRVIATSFDIDEFADALNLQKATYRNYLGVILLAIDVILFYNNINNKLILSILIFTIIATNLLLYIVFIKNNQNSILNKLFYFILYLCTLEIAPYLLIYFWFKNFRA